MKRGGTTLKVLQDGHPRRMADARNAWRKMSDEQRRVFLAWMGLRPLDGDGAGTIAVKGEVLDALLVDRAWEQS